MTQRIIPNCIMHVSIMLCRTETFFGVVTVKSIPSVDLCVADGVAVPGGKPNRLAEFLHVT